MLADLVIPPWVRLALKIAPYLAIAILCAVIAFGWQERGADKAALTAAAARMEAFADRVRADTAAAHAADQANARRVERAQDVITQETARDLSTKLADARRLAADYARRLRAEAAQADPGRGGATDLPGAAVPAGRAVGAGGAAQLDDDARIAAENTVRAEAWRDWWMRQAAVAR